jgi:hypothetical protein
MTAGTTPPVTRNLPISAEMLHCIKNCLECHSICVKTAMHCLEMGGRHAEPAHIRLLWDCADICRVSADFMLRGSDLHTRTCAACAEICERCAEDCERFGPEDKQMRACVDACRVCASSCRRMAEGA